MFRVSVLVFAVAVGTGLLSTCVAFLDAEGLWVFAAFLSAEGFSVLTAFLAADGLSVFTVFLGAERVSVFAEFLDSTSTDLAFDTRTAFLAAGLFATGFALVEISSKGFFNIVLRDRVTIAVYLA
jgi:hypothetical protein